MADDLPFRVDLWDERQISRVEVLALAADFLIGKAAYEAAVKRRPGEPITLRQGARVILKTG